MLTISETIQREFEVIRSFREALMLLEKGDYRNAALELNRAKEMAEGLDSDLSSNMIALIVTFLPRLFTKGGGTM